jgi:peptidoglycan/LPS O-acetylase OafA/YrhL
MIFQEIKHSDYRPDIDGLRAFAVAAVVTYHAFPSLISGGFVGVDIFFVISGFLISGIIFDDLQAGVFNFSDFYARRVKRIFPALILVLLVSFLFAWFVLFNDELKQLGKHLMRAAVFLSNFILWHESGYFDNAAETKPLLHLWSLAIEEQFYIVWPVVIWGVWRFKSWRGSLLVAATTLSFVWNYYQSQLDLVHDFYSPLTRFWELLFGSLLAYASRSEMGPAFSAQNWWIRTRDLRGFLGFGLLVLSVAKTDALHFPGVWALLPVLGAVLVISSTMHAWVNRIVFSHSALVWVGTISYPLYLWHWPIFSFARIISGETPSVAIRCGALLTSIVFAWITFVAVEKPLRFGWAYRYKTASLIIAMTFVGALGYVAYKNDGYPMRAVMDPQRVVHDGDIGHDVFHEYFQQHFFPCAEHAIQKEAGTWKGMTRCFQSKAHAQVDLVLLGDSHAEHLFLGLAEALPQLNVSFYVKGAMPLMFENEFRTIFKHLLATEHIRDVLIVANWERKLKESSARAAFVANLDQTVKALSASGKRVTLMSDLPQFNFDPQRCKFQRPLITNTQCDEPIENHIVNMQTYWPALKEVQTKNPDVRLLDVSGVMCAKGRCSMAPQGQLLYRDNNHLNILGSQYVGTHVAKFYLRAPRTD